MKDNKRNNTQVLAAVHTHLMSNAGLERLMRDIQASMQRNEQHAQRHAKVVSLNEYRRRASDK